MNHNLSLHALVNSLPPWKNELLSHIESTMTPYELSTVITNIDTNLSCPILAACDGGGGSITTFGWTLRSGSSDLAHCYGPVSGYHANAYCAEATGLLSLLVFLDLIWPSLFSSTSSSLPIYIDNQALCKRVHAHQRRIYFSPTEALGPERDILLQIKYILDHSSLRITIHHERGHQDRHTPLHLLPYPAQANCQADSLATAAQAVIHSHPTAFLLPAAGCNLILCKATITRVIPQLLRCHAHKQHLRQWILKSGDWSSTDYIDWTFFSTFCLQNTPNLCFCLRWTHRALPTGHVLHRRNNRKSPLCPACGQYESHTHFVICSHPTRTPLKVRLICSLCRTLQSSILDPILSDIIVEGINSAILNTTFSPVRYPSRYQQLLWTQAEIGWMNLLRGFVSTEWSRLDRVFLVSRKLPPNTPSPLSCLSKMVDQIFQLWQFRNTQRHSADLAQHQSELLRQAKQQIQDLYQYQHSVLPTDRHIFHKSLTTHLTESLSRLQAWLHNHSHYILQSHQQAQRIHTTHTRPLTHYFSTLS